ncbi:MAG: LytR/AlgR family response regulator transcription factor [Saprospiraceae bacterium]
MSATIKVGIIEDEPHAAERIVHLLKSYPSATIEVVGQTDSIGGALETLPSWNADLLLCDIRLADGLSFTIWQHIDVTTPTIFTTAYEEYALKAFKVNSVDYLLKPIKGEDLYAALDQFQKLNKKTDTPAETKLSAELIAEVARMVNRKSYRERLMSKVGTKLTPIYVSEIAYFLSIDRITWAYGFDGSRQPLNENLDELEQLLNPKNFRRLNRASIAQASAVEQLNAYSNSRFAVQLPNYKGEPIIIARDRVQGVKDWLAD